MDFNPGFLRPAKIFAGDTLHDIFCNTGVICYNRGRKKDKDLHKKHLGDVLFFSSKKQILHFSFAPALINVHKAQDKMQSLS